MLMPIYPATLEALEAVAHDPQELLKLTKCPGSITGNFWTGDYDDFSAALSDAGWQVTWPTFEDYLFTAIKDGTTIHYIEGDIYTGDQRPY